MSSTLKQAILSLKNRIADAYTAVSQKGGTLPATQDSANLPTAIASIPSGGGEEKVCEGTYTCNMTFEWYKGFENSITILRSNFITGATSSNRTIIDQDVTFRRLTNTIGNIHIFRFATVNGDLYFPELEETGGVGNTQASLLSYSDVRDIYLPKFRNGLIIFGGAESARNIYLGATKGGSIKLSYFTFTNFSNLFFADEFGNSFDYNGSNRPKQELLDNINALYDFAADPLAGFTPTLTMGATNLAKLSADEIAIATNKGWTLA